MSRPITYVQGSNSANKYMYRNTCVDVLHLHLLTTDKTNIWLQSTCGAYELLFHDCVSGKRQPGATKLRDVQWSTWTATLGWPVQVQFQLLHLTMLQLLEHRYA
jgi:hypothetical protein